MGRISIRLIRFTMKKALLANIKTVAIYISLFCSCTLSSIDINYLELALNNFKYYNILGIAKRHL